MAYTTIDDPTIYFNTKLYTGNGGTNAITGVGFQPDWVWLKSRNATHQHFVFDVVRGATKEINTNATQEEQTKTDTLTSFDTDGYTLSDRVAVNNNSDTFVSWNWKAGGSASSNSNGSITSSVSASTDAGFSIVSYTGNGTDGATVGHGLTSPKLVLIKDRDNSTPWLMYGYPNHSSFPNDGSLIKLNESDAMVTDDSTTELSIGSSTVTFVDAGSAINANSTQFIMYCFQEKKGFSKFESYTGNGNADGTFIYTGFKPAMIIFKQTNTSGGHWYIYDNKRGQNELDEHLYPNLSSAEATGDNAIDILSNGFKMRSSNGDSNASGSTYIYMAFAESPFVTGASAIPTTAR